MVGETPIFSPRPRLFLARIANAINNLRGESGMALSQSRSAEEYRRTLKSSLEEFARVSALNDNLLFLARAESPTAGVHRTGFEAREAIKYVRAFYEALAKDRGVTLNCNGRGRASADPTLFRQAVSKLRANALNHTPREGRVKVRTAQRDGLLEILVTRVERRNIMRGLRPGG